jgi:2'-5' RNA ligase
MRLFFAIELSAGVADAIEAASRPLRDAAPDLAWVLPEKRHITLKFLGDVDESALPQFVVAADRAASASRPFEMAVGGIGAFPNFRRVRVVWVGVESEPRLELLHHDLEVGCVGAGIEVEGRPFRPHVTLARVRSVLPLDEARALARAARKVAFSATQDVAVLTLFESVPAPSGTRYRRVHTATLGGR